MADVAELAGKVGVAVDDDPAVTARGVRDWLETTTRPWLLIFDNAVDEASVEPWRPRRGVGATVVTSWSRNMSRLGPVVPVDVFRPGWPTCICGTGSGPATRRLRART